MNVCFVAFRDIRRWYRDSSRELLIVLGPLRFLAAAPFYTLSFIFLGFMERSFQFDDRLATFYFGLWGASNMVFTFAGGWICDAIGARLALAAGAFASAFGYVLLTSVHEIGPQFWLAMYVLIPFGVGLGVPVGDVANRRLSTPVNEYAVYPFGHSIASLGQCVGLAALAITAAVYFSDNRHGTDGADYDTTTERVVLGLCALASVILGVAALAMNAKSVGPSVRAPTVNVDDDGDPEPVTRQQHVTSFMRSARESFVAIRTNTGFRRTALFVFLTLPARHVFILLYTTLAIYIRRTLGADVPVYAFMMIDPALEFLLAPLFALFLPQIDIYWMMLLGIFIASTGLSGFVTLEMTMLSLGMTLSVFAVGSAMYLPRIPQYVLVQAPEGHEGRFAAIASALPITVGKIIIAAAFGPYLDQTCPIHATPEDCKWLWLPSVIASFCSFVLLLLCKPIIHTAEVKQRFASRLETMRTAIGPVELRSTFD